MIDWQRAFCVPASASRSRSPESKDLLKEQLKELLKKKLKELLKALLLT